MREHLVWEPRRRFSGRGREKYSFISAAGVMTPNNALLGKVPVFKKVGGAARVQSEVGSLRMRSVLKVILSVS